MGLQLQSDNKGKDGDVRDVLIIRSGLSRKIGLSVKHNHFAVEHSRLAKSLDFGEKWFDVKCSSQYWADIKPIFKYLEAEKKSDSKWNELPSKKQDVYVPLLQAFMNELHHSNTNAYNAVPRKMVELYLDGGWQFSFRIHNASTKVETSLKFDVQIIGVPVDVVYTECRWT